MSTLKITPFGGLGEIGMNCMLIETDSSAILIDCGLMFSELDHFGVEFVIPNFSKILEKKDKIKAIFATHGHEDHIGAIGFALKAGLRVPIYASHFTSLMIRERLQEFGMTDVVEVRRLLPGEKATFGNLSVTPQRVNHSIIDAMALFIDTPLGKVIHTGDFKIDASPHVGDVGDWREFEKAGDSGVFLLMSDSTNVEREDHDHQDVEIAKTFDEIFRKAQGMVVVSMFSSNMGRVADILKVAEKLGKKVAFTGRSMEQNIRLAYEHGILANRKDLFVKIEDLDRFPRNRVIVLSTGCQGEPRSALNRMAFGEHPHVSLTEEDLVVFSSSQIPGNEVAISKLINELFKTGAQVLYDSIECVHTTGHATRPELKKMIQMTKPKFFMPVHGEYRHLVLHGDLAFECGIPDSNIMIAQNGDVVEFKKESVAIIETLSELRILVEGREGQEVTKSLLKDRRRMAETGVVLVLLTREKDHGKILSGPEVIVRGVVNEALELWMLDEAKKAMLEVIKRDEKERRATGQVNPDLGEELRIELRRFFDRNLGKKPTVIPVILDL